MLDQTVMAWWIVCFVAHLAGQMLNIIFSRRARFARGVLIVLTATLAGALGSTLIGHGSWMAHP